MPNPFTGYRPGVAAIADTKPKPPPGTNPMEPVAPPVKPVEPAKPPTGIDRRHQQLQDWARGNMRRITTYGRGNQVQQQGNYTVAPQRGIGTGGQMYDPSIYGSTYTGPRYGVNNLPPGAVGNPSVWDPQWMQGWNDYRNGTAPPPGWSPPITMPGGGIYQPPGGG